jgi:thiol:disulfide interchange protein DsbD
MRSLVSILFLFLSHLAWSQILTPTHWQVTASKTEALAGDEIDLILKATIDEGWYVYSVGFDPDCGPILMGISLQPSRAFEPAGGLKAIGDASKHDEVFGCEVRYFKHAAEFRQKVRLLGGEATLAGTLEGQVCSDKDGKCIAFEDDFSVRVKVKSVAEQPESTSQPPPVSVDTAGAQVQPVAEVPETERKENSGPLLDESILEGEPSYGRESFGALLLVAFLAGFAALITPCVFPMVPMTVTFFLRDNQSKWEGIRKALLFGTSIIVIYTAAGTLFAILLGAEGLNALATHWAPNLFVFVIFIAFALSFFGLFEITAPHKLVNKVDQQAEKGGLMGVFFMAATLVLVSFSCTVPIVGSVLTFSAGGELIKPILMMFFYSLAFALPFTLFAFFPELIKQLPKSGGWLNSVKVSLGFLELALSLKFFSIADQAYHWGILDRDTNLVLWIVIFGLMGLYLLGKIQLPHDNKLEKIGVLRLLFVISVFSFVVYLVPGLFGAPLKALAGYLPPLHTHDFDLLESQRSKPEGEGCEQPKYADFLHLPHGLAGYFDYDQAIECSRASGKPLFIDFTGHGCTNCREMEAVVWSDPRVLQRLKSDFVVVALYVDDKTELPEAEWLTSKHDGKVKKTIGKRNADVQISNLNNNAQPFYVLVGDDERVLMWPYDYDRSVDNFVEFLDGGVAKYKELFPKP